MSELDESILLDNGIVRSKDSDDLYCSICTVSVRIESWEKHIKDPYHVCVLKEFNVMFANCGEHIYCKFCDAVVNWETVKLHVKAHETLPWYEPEDKFVTFFENSIIAYNAQFYCCLCEVSLLEWFSVFVHISDLQHENLHKKCTSLRKISFSLDNAINHKLLVCHALVPLNSTSLECKICNNKTVDFIDVLEHIETFDHTSLKLQFHPESLEKKNVRITPKVLEGDPTDELETLKLPKVSDNEPEQNFSSNCFQPYATMHSRCVICNVIFFADQTKNHIVDKVHTDAAKLYGCENVKSRGETDFYCECCNCLISGVENVFSHVKGRHHANRLSRITKRYEITENYKATPLRVMKTTDTPRTSSHWFVVETNSGDSHCIVCNRVLSSSASSIDNHLSEKSHTNALYTFQNVIPREENTYYCESCDIVINDLDYLQRHVKQMNHQRSSFTFNVRKARATSGSPLEMKISKKPETIDIPEKVEVSKNPKQLENVEIQRKTKNIHNFGPTTNIMQNYCIVGKKTGNSWCKICEVKLSGYKEIENHLSGAEHESKSKHYGFENITMIGSFLYNCNCCKCKISGIENVCAHVKGRWHTSSLSAVKREFAIGEENSTIANKPELSKVLSTVVTTEFSKLFDKLRARRVKGTVKQRFGRDIVTSETIAENQSITCNFCPVVLSNGAELHSHLANHFGLEFVNSSVDKNANNDYSSAVRKSNGITNDENRLIDENSNNQLFNGIAINCCSEGSSANDESTKQRKAVNFPNETTSNDRQFLSEGTTRKMPVKSVGERLDFEKNYIYEIAEKLRVVELGMKLCFINDTKTIYCLVCRKIVENTLQRYFEHLSALDHSACLESMEKDHALFERAAEQFSELQLAHEYMEERSDEIVRCLICEMNVDNNDNSLRDHTIEANHEMTRVAMHFDAKQNFNDVKRRTRCDWYNVEKYWCVPCSEYYQSEIKFVKHLESHEHAMIMKNVENNDRTLVYDFCSSCALLWYGYRCTYAYHSEIPLHKWLVRDGHYSSKELPEVAKTLLANPQRYANDASYYLDDIGTREREREKNLMKDLEETIRKIFSHARAHGFGSRLSGLGSTDSSLDLFLDCRQKLWMQNVTSRKKDTKSK